MPKQLYEEALADVKKLKEVAEDNAKRALTETLVPKIRNLIEQQLFNESEDEAEVEEDVPAHPGSPDKKGDLMTDNAGLLKPQSASTVPPEAGYQAPAIPPAPPSSPSPVTPQAVVGGSDALAASVTMPDETGKVTLDVDALVVPDETGFVEPPLFGVEPVESEFELSVESIKKLSNIVSSKDFELSLFKLSENVDRFSKASRLIRETSGFRDEITRMISLVENMYEYVQKANPSRDKKEFFEQKLETIYERLNSIQEQNMSKKNAKNLNEADVTLKLTGLPDEIDLENVGVDLVTGEEDEADLAPVDDGEGNLDFGDEGEEASEDELDFGSEEEPVGEALNLSDDTLVEVDENVLRSEIARLRKLREAKAEASKKHSDFGGGKSEGDPWLDGEVVTEGEEEDEETMTEADVDDHSEKTGSLKMEGDDELYESRLAKLNRRLAFEKNLQEGIKNRAVELKREARRSKAPEARERYSKLVERYNQSVARSNELSSMLSEATALKKKSPNGNSNRLAESRDVKELREKLAETNLFNTKLMYTNKLLQNEALSKKQKAEVIERLDEAKTEREVKLVYDALCKTIAGTSRSLSEGAERRVLGSSSAPTTRSASTVINEGIETSRWQKLAGIK